MIGRWAPLLLLVLMPTDGSASEARLIHEQHSLYQRVHVVEEDGLRCLRFKVRNADDTSQSCIDLDDPDRLVFFYYRQAMAATFVLEPPESILVVGLGGGVITRAFRSLYPAARIDAVEIDAVVVDMARRFFDFDDDALAVDTAVMDGRVWVKRALRREQRYQLILLDAFTGDYIPEHMLTREYLQEVKGLLAPGGLVVANTHSTSKLFQHESATYHDVFGDFYQVRLPQSEVSRVIIASDRRLPAIRELLPRANRLRNRLSQMGVDALMLFEAISDRVNWDTRARVLTDQYSPANLLNED